MTNRELGFEIGKMAREERRITGEILKLIQLGLERRAYLEHGFPSMFEWLVKGFGYSHAAAFRRIEAARLIKAVPEAADKLESGELNLTTLSKAQTAIRAQEKSNGQKVDAATKEQIIQNIRNKSATETEQVLCRILPESKASMHRETRTVIDEDTTRFSMNFSESTCADLRRAKELLSHKIPNASDSDVIAFALKFLLEKSDPLQKSTSAAASKRVTKVGAKRLILKAASGACTFKDPVSGKVCGSRHQIELDHIVPKALGGSDDPDNLRPLCRQHNLLMAERAFGKNQMEKYRRE